MKSLYAAVPPYLVASEEEAIWYLGALFTVRASAQSTAGVFDLLEVVMPEGASPPPDIHHREDEFVYVLDGQITFTCGERTIHAERGAFVFLPRDVAHTFRVEGPGPAHVLNLCVPAGLKEFFKEMGEPARERTLPPPQALDLARLRLVASKYGIQIPRPMPENNEDTGGAMPKRQPARRPLPREHMTPNQNAYMEYADTLIADDPASALRKTLTPGFLAYDLPEGQ